MICPDPSSPQTAIEPAELLAQYVPTVERIVSQAEQRVFQGVMLAADEKVYSLFEEHTELLKRGKAGKPIEFGHKVLIAQTGEKFIYHYRVLPKREEDKEILEPTLKAHKQLFGTGPEVLATDKGFYENMKQIFDLEEKNITTVSICKKGRRNQGELQRENTEEFKENDDEIDLVLNRMVNSLSFSVPSATETN